MTWFHATAITVSRNRQVKRKVMPKSAYVFYMHVSLCLSRCSAGLQLSTVVGLFICCLLLSLSLRCRCRGGRCRCRVRCRCRFLHTDVSAPRVTAADNAHLGRAQECLLFAYLSLCLVWTTRYSEMRRFNEVESDTLTRCALCLPAQVSHVMTTRRRVGKLCNAH